jgi:hypothetical protein
VFNFFILGVGIELELLLLFCFVLFASFINHICMQFHIWLPGIVVPTYQTPHSSGNTWELGKQIESVLRLTIENALETWWEPLKPENSFQTLYTPSPPPPPPKPQKGKKKKKKKKVGPLGCMLSLLIGYVNFYSLSGNYFWPG